MKQITVLKALNSMDEKKVSEFLNEDFRDLGEIVEALCEEVEVGYIEFMYELIQKCKAIEVEEKIKNNSDNLVRLKKEDVLILKSDEYQKFREALKDYVPPIHSMFSVPKMDFPNIISRRN